jgi:hypothetical protein
MIEVDGCRKVSGGDDCATTQADLDVLLGTIGCYLLNRGHRLSLACGSCLMLLLWRLPSTRFTRCRRRCTLLSNS